MPRTVLSHPETFILMAMIRMALADRCLGDDEVTEICRIYRDVTLSEIDRTTIVEIAKSIEDDADTPLDWLRRLRESLEEATKELIITAVYRVLLADGLIAGEELKQLTETADALAMSETHYKAVLEALEEQMGRTS